MSERYFKDWLPAFLSYASHVEAPRIMQFWSGVSAIAGALRKKVWIDQHYYRWSPNFFIMLVAPPGVVAKSTTAEMALALLREVPGIKFGPDIVTWPALVSAFAAASESFQHGEDWIPMSPITMVSSEFGNLLDPSDKGMVNLFIDLWDGRKKLDKQTKMSGDDLVEAPWANMIACTTPNWISDNMSNAMIGGGFMSRCVCLYTERKFKTVAYPGRMIPPDIEETRRKLIHDLEHIAVHLCGEYAIDEEAYAWGTQWYDQMWIDADYTNEQMSAYRSRKQTHVHKLAMILAASQRDELHITLLDLKTAESMLSAIEADMPKIFSHIGRTKDSLQAERFIDLIRRKGKVPYEEAYKSVHVYFPDFKDFEGILAGSIRSGQLKLTQASDGKFWLESVGIPPAVIPG